MNASLFGPLSLTNNRGNPLPLPPTANGRQLLAYLLLYADMPHGRVALATLLDPESSEEKARRTLSQALWQLRRILPPESIVSVGDTILLEGARVQRDVTQFDALLGEVLHWEKATAERLPQLQQGVQLYTADLLTDCYDDWVYLPREQRRERYLRALGLLLEWEKSHGRFGVALDYALKLSQADPWQEATHREVMRLYLALNRPQAAQQHYADMTRLFEQELHLAPESETRQLVAELTAQSDAPTPALYLPLPEPTPAYALQEAGQMPLVGRERERRQLVAQLDGLGQGQGGVLFLSGAAGIGKSRLLEEFARDAQWRGITVAWGHGRELDALAPYALFTEALTPLLTPLRWAQLRGLGYEQAGVLTDTLFASDPNKTEAISLPHREYLLEGLRRLLDGLGRLNPLLLLFDDVQWADEATWEGVQYVAQRLHDTPLFILLAFRTDEAQGNTAVWNHLTQLDQIGVRLRLQLDPLTPAATAQFIQRGLGLRQEAPLFSQRLLAETGGHPLLLLESLRTLHDEGVLYRDERGAWHTPFDQQTADYGELPIGHNSPTAQALLQRRLRQLPPPAYALLQLAAVVGRDVPFEWLMAATEPPLPISEGLRLLRQLQQRQFLQETPEAYRFTHDKVREVVYASLDPDQRRAYHRQVAGVIAERDNTAVVRLAYHYQQAEQWAEAFTYTMQAAAHAHQLQAFRSALADYDTALAILDKQSDLSPAERVTQQVTIWLARQPFLYLLGETETQSAELAQLKEAAPQLTDPALQVAVLLKEADFAVQVQMEHKGAIQLAQEALVLAEAHELTKDTAVAWQIIGYAYYLQGAYQQSNDALRQAITLAEAQQVEPLSEDLLRAYLRLIYNERNLGHAAQGQALAHQLLALAQEAGHEMGTANAQSALANFATDGGDYLTAVGAYQSALACFRRLGIRTNEARTIANLGYTYWALQDYDPAIQMTQEALQIFTELRDQKGVLLSYLNLAALHYDVGQFQTGLSYSELGMALAQQLNLPNYKLLFDLGQAQAFFAQEAWANGEGILQAISLQIAQQEDLHTLALFQMCWGMWHTAQAAWEDAVKAFTKAEELFQQEGYADFVVAMQSFGSFAAGQMGEGHLAQALAKSTTALAALEAMPGGEFVAHIYWYHAQLLELAGERLAARSFLEKGYTAVVTQAKSLHDPDWQAAWWAMPLHQKISQAWAETRPIQTTVSLPQADAPTRGKLAVDQLIPVRWTPYDPLVDGVVQDKKGRRHGQLQRLMGEAAEQGARATIEALSTAVGVSQPTIKRDLAELKRGV